MYACVCNSRPRQTPTTNGQAPSPIKSIKNNTLIDWWIGTPRWKAFNSSRKSRNWALLVGARLAVCFTPSWWPNRAWSTWHSAPIQSIFSAFHRRRQLAWKKGVHARPTISILFFFFLSRVVFFVCLGLIRIHRATLALEFLPLLMALLTRDCQCPGIDNEALSLVGLVGACERKRWIMYVVTVFEWLSFGS